MFHSEISGRVLNNKACRYSVINGKYKYLNIKKERRKKPVSRLTTKPPVSNYSVDFNTLLHYSVLNQITYFHKLNIHINFVAVIHLISDSQFIR